MARKSKSNKPTSAADFVEMMNAAGFYYQKDLAAALGVTRTRVGWFLSGKVKIPLYITLAMQELIHRHNERGVGPGRWVKTPPLPTTRGPPPNTQGSDQVQ